MFSALTATLGQLSDPRLRNPIILSVIGSLATIFLLGAAVWFVLDFFAFFGGWLDELAAWVASLIVVILGLVFFPGASNAISSLFLDSVSGAVEAKHYPTLGPARPQPLSEAILEGLRFLAITVAVNILLLPVYLLVPGLNIVIFYGANGYLLGREFFEMVAMRRMEPAEAKALRKRKSGAVFISGVLIAAIMTIPILNLAGPVIATAFMLHRFEYLRNDMKK
ncbi:EI24 domain-containing protein [Nisaea acidiphila]|uniref:EI24 domain-containing protein n=1 Tax=Nisaea acidiphila TaxID=1862145 RepID=A0A9J7B3D6_9PROT|nr:EI24 domain-containing protein [Nisaea acidiphila]UUX52149.1 EI24 domain-containing protein [Nisaea acidiphila]